MNIFWFRRDLRLHDNTALMAALEKDEPVLPIFIFDPKIISHLEKNDARISFIHGELEKINTQLKKYDSGVKVYHGNPDEVWTDLLDIYDVNGIYVNEDYEPYANERDGEIQKIAESKGVKWNAFTDQVMMHPSTILKGDGTPYTVFTPFKKQWMPRFDREANAANIKSMPSSPNFYGQALTIPTLEELGFEKSDQVVYPVNLDVADEYDEKRNFPAMNHTSFLGPHLRFGTVSIRQMIADLNLDNPRQQKFLDELIWREFFTMILYRFPNVVKGNFKSKYDRIEWVNNEDDFKKWCKGETGYPMVDAGMRQLNETGYMSNRVRMVTASFLCKHLLIDWRWGEAYFASKLLDFDLSSNNGNWQWVAGTGCDAAPYFRVFNPTEQQRKFDPDGEYVRHWVKDLQELTYPAPMVEHKFARERALKVYKVGLEG